MRLHREWLRGENPKGADQAMELYTEASILMRNSLATSYAPFDLYVMAIGAIIAVTVKIFLFNFSRELIFWCLLSFSVL